MIYTIVAKVPLKNMLELVDENGKIHYWKKLNVVGLSRYKIGEKYTWTGVTIEKVV